ncbi:MAG: sulfotransferase [Acetobacterales bacterium]
MRHGRQGGATAPGALAVGRQLASAWQLMQAGRADAAEQAVRAALRQAPRDPDALEFLGLLLLQRGAAEQAVAPLQRAVRARPEKAAAHYNLGCALASAGRPRDAAAALRRATELDPARPEAWANLGNVLQELDDRAGAIACYREAARLAPGDVAPYSNLGAALLYEGRPEEAEAALREALSRDATHAGAWNNLGNTLKSLGRLDEAAAAYRRALTLQPGMGEALANLADIDERAGDRPTADRLKAAAADAAQPPQDRIAAAFAAGRVLAQLDEHEQAFDAYAAGNALRRALDRSRGAGFDRAAHSRRVDRLISAYTAGALAAAPDAAGADRTPVFVLGMPRSGSTLVEQILASHPDVAGAGEVPCLEEVLSAAGALAAPETLVATAEADRLRLGAAYIERLRRAAPEQAPRITDKTPVNFLHIGAIALTLPGARIVHSRRDPADTALSCFFQNFGRGNAFTNDLGDLGAFYRDYLRLMAHWREAGATFLDLDYEELVAEPEKTVRGLLDFVDLPWDPDCLRFHENPRAVLTASNAQVRRPLYGGAVARWRRYERQLAPFFAALGQSPR